MERRGIKGSVQGVACMRHVGEWRHACPARGTQAVAQAKHAPVPHVALTLERWRQRCLHCCYAHKTSPLLCYRSCTVSNQTMQQPDHAATVALQ
jgi:hypothetical protein